MALRGACTAMAHRAAKLESGHETREEQEQRLVAQRCDVCGHEMGTRQCILFCPVCGYERDCSDP